MSTPEDGVRHLFLLRHADAVDAGPDLADIDRPLTKRGRRQSAYVADRLKAVAIDYVLCSSSTRTRETVMPVLATRCAELPTIVFDKRLYEADAQTMLRLLHAIPADARSTLVVGHNPAMVDLLDLLAPGTSRPDGFKKGACIHLEVRSAWRNLGAGATKLAGYERGESEPA